MKILPLLGVCAAALALTAAAPAPKVVVADAWCRPAPTGALAGGCYVTLTASVDDRLVAVETTAADRGEWDRDVLSVAVDFTNVQAWST